MPINNDLPDKKFPFTIKRMEQPTTEYLEALSAIKVKLIQSPSLEELMDYIPEFALATWEDKPRSDYTEKERYECITKLLRGEVLPTALETVGLTFLISNIDLIDVTHLIRHRTMSFSAHCTGDRDQRHDPCLVKPSILVDPEYVDRFMNIVDDAKELYADMVDSGQVSILDARTILPRALTNHYYARVNLKDFIGYLRQRLDRQIQPESDNIIALKMLVEANKKLPGLKEVVDLNAPDHWFVKTAQTDHSSNLYRPETPRNDVFEWKPQWFVYGCERKDMPGGEYFTTLWNNLVEELNNG
jgi:thymidylate synthase (FAD)